MLTFLRKIIRNLVNILEVYVPALALCVLFIVFNLQIFYRYVLNDPLKWANEVSLTCFLWAVMLGAAYAWRKKDHVMFTILYDLLSPKWQLWMRVLGNCFIVVSLIIILYPVYDQLLFMKRLSSTVLDIPLSIVFAPTLISFILIIGHALEDIYQDIKKIKRNDGNYAETVYSDQYDEVEDETIPTALRD